MGTPVCFMWYVGGVALDVLGLPMEPKVKTYGQMIARATLIAHAVIGTSGSTASISWLGFGEMLGGKVPRSLWGEIQGRGVVVVDQGRR